MDFKRSILKTTGSGVKRKTRPHEADESASSALLTGVMRLQRLLGNQATTRIMRWEDPAMSNQVMAGFGLLEPSTLDAAPQEPFVKPSYETMSFENLLAYKDRALSDYDIASAKDSAEAAEKELALINAALEARAETIFSGFNADIAPTLADIALAQGDGPKKEQAAAQTRLSFGLPAAAADRVKFINVMSLYLGSVDNVAAHFKAVRRAKVPGIVYLHESAAAQLEAVQEIIGKDKMPASGTALGIRGRYHTRESKSRMAHPLGYAVDYYPLDNPMVTDDRTLKLLELATGESTHLNMTNKKGGVISRNQRRSMITAMAEGKDKTDPALGEAVEHMMSQVEDEVVRVANVSMKFRKSLGEKNTSDLRKLRVEYLNLKADQARLSKMTSKDAIVKLLKKVMQTHKGKLDPAAMKNMMAEAETGLTQADAKLDSLLAPWTELITTRAKELDSLMQEMTKRIQEIEKRLQDITKRVADIDTRKGELDKVLKDKTTPAEAKTALKAERTSLNTERTALVTEQTSLTKEKTALEEKRKTPDAELKALQQFGTQVVEIEQSAETMKKNKDRLAQVPDEMQKLMKPWLTLIEADLKTQNDVLAPLDKRLKEIDERLQAVVRRLQEIVTRTSAITAALKAKGLTAEAKAKLVTEQGDLKKEKDLLTAEKTALTIEQGGLQKQAANPGAERDLLMSLQETLKDPEYVLGGTTGEDTLDNGVKDVALMQLVNRGFFTIEGDQYDPDVQMHDGSIRHRKKYGEDTREGFNATFMKAMMRKGFDLGIAWDTLDAMHFELVSGVEGVKDEKDTAAGFADVKDRYATRKPKVFKEPTPAPGTP